MNDEANNKAAAVEFVRMIADRKIKEAFNSYVNMAGIHHNPYYPAGFPALMGGMIENDPNIGMKEVTIKNAVAEHDRVVVHFSLKLLPYVMEVAYIFRFEAGKIVELWDVGGPIPDEAPFKANI